MLLRRVFLGSIFLLALGSAIAFIKPNPLFPRSLAQNFREQKSWIHSDIKLMDRLDLTSEQKQKLRTIYSQYKNPIYQRKQAVRQSTRELRTLMVGTASTHEIRAKYQEVQSLRQQLDSSSFESMLAMREVLTPAQRNEFAQLMEQQGKMSQSRITD